MNRPIEKPRRASNTRGALEVANRWGVIDDAKHTPQMASLRIQAAAAIRTACEQLDWHALAADAPDLATVDAADLLDAARDAQAGSL